MGFALAACLSLGGSVGAAPVRLIVGSATSPPSAQVQLPISVEAGQGVGAIQFHLRYDPDVLEWVDGETAPGSDSVLPDFKLVNPGRVRVAVVLGQSGIRGDLTLLNTRFKVTGLPGRRTAVEIDSPRAWTHEDIVEMRVETGTGGVDVIDPPGGAGVPWAWVAGGVVAVGLLFVLLRMRKPRRIA